MKTARRIAAAKALAVIAGLAAVVLGIVTGNLWMAFAVAAFASGAELLATVADLREVEARCEAAGRLHQREAAIEQERDRERGIEEGMADLRDDYAALDGMEGGSGRLRERVSAEGTPGRERLH